MKHLTSFLFVALFSVSAHAEGLLGPYETQLGSCESANGTALLASLQMQGYRPELEVMLDPAATARLRSLLNQDVIEGLDHTNYFAIGSNSISMPSFGPLAGTARLSQVTDPREDAPAPRSFTSIASESSIYVQAAGRGVPDSIVGKTAISSGFYAFLDQNNTLVVRIFRTSNDQMGIPGLLIGELSFPNCK